MPTSKFRQDSVLNLPYVGTGKSQCIYWDQALSGFGVRVYSSTKRTYVCAYRIDKQKRLVILGRVNVLTLDQARKKARAYLGRVASGEDPQADKKAKWASGSLKELADAYIEGHAKPKKTTWKTDQSTIRRNLIPKLGGRPAASITSGDIEPIHRHIGVDHPYAANTFLEIIRKMFNWGRVTAKLPPSQLNPAQGIVFFPVRKRRRFVTTTEMPRFLQAVEYEESEYARHAVWLLLLMGVRLKELLRAKWEHIDWDANTLFVGFTKNGDPLLAPLSQSAIERLKQIPRQDGNPHIICGRDQGQPMFNMRKAWVRIRTAAQMPDLRIHDLRRTVGSWLARDGQSLHLIGQVLNHRDTKTTAGYAYFQTGDRQDALSAHGEKVLSFSTQIRSRVEAQLPPPISYAPPKAALEAIAPERRSYYLPREDLYELVWERPVTEVAMRFGISDVGLSKICRRANIPVPKRGYWAKMDAGEDVERLPLGAAPRGTSDKVRIRGRPPQIGATNAPAAATRRAVAA